MGELAIIADEAPIAGSTAPPAWAWASLAAFTSGLSEGTTAPLARVTRLGVAARGPEYVMDEAPAAYGAPEAGKEVYEAEEAPAGTMAPFGYATWPEAGTTAPFGREAIPAAEGTTAPFGRATWPVAGTTAPLGKVT